MKTPTLSPQEMMEVIHGWMDGNTLDEIMYLLAAKGKPKSRRYLIRLFMGAIHQDITGIARSETYIQAKIRYSRRKVDTVFGNDD